MIAGWVLPNGELREVPPGKIHVDVLRGLSLRFHDWDDEELLTHFVDNAHWCLFRYLGNGRWVSIAPDSIRLVHQVAPLIIRQAGPGHTNDEISFQNTSGQHIERIKFSQYQESFHSFCSSRDRGYNIGNDIGGLSSR